MSTEQKLEEYVKIYILCQIYTAKNKGITANINCC